MSRITIYLTYKDSLVMSDSDSDELISSQLAKAASAGDLSELQGLVRNWPSGKPIENNLQSALSTAVGQGHVPAVSYLMDLGANFHADMAYVALSCKNAEDIFQLARIRGWDINSRTTIGLPVFACVLLRPQTSYI